MADSAAIFVLLFTLCAGSLASTRCQRRVDLGFVLDRSASIGEENFKYIKSFVKDVIHHFAISDKNVRIGIIPFSKSFKIEFGFTNFTEGKELDKAIDRIGYEGSVSLLSLAMKVAQLQLFATKPGEAKPDPKNVLQALVIIADGGSSTGIDLLLDAATTLKDAGKRLFVVGLGKRESKSSLRMIASDPLASHYFNVREGKNLKRILGKLTQRICKDTRSSVQQFKVTEGKETIALAEYRMSEKAKI